MKIAAILAFAAFHLFSFLALVVKPSPYRGLLMIPIALTFVMYFRSLKPGPEYSDQIANMFAGSPFIHFFVAADYILLTDVQRELMMKGQKQPIYERPLLERIKWATSLYINSRGIGWSHEPTHALPSPLPPSMSRSKFIIYQLRLLAIEYALYAATAVYIRRTPAFMLDGHSFGEDGVFWLCVNSTVSFFRGFANLSTTHETMGLVCVAAGIWEPYEWVPFFGSISEGYSLRNFWGRFWHQSIRRPLGSFGQLMAFRILDLKKGSLSAYLVQVYAAFTISGLMHLGFDYLRIGKWTYQRAFLYFFSQAVGIHIEVLFTRWFSVPKSWYWMGYIWVFAWSVYTLPIWLSGVLWYSKLNTTEYLACKLFGC